MHSTKEASPTRVRDIHDIWLHPETVALRDQARRAAEKFLGPPTERIGSAQGSAWIENFPWEAFRGLAEAGLYGVAWPHPFGTGLEHRTLGTSTVAEEIAYHSASMAAIYARQAILLPQAVSFAPSCLQQRIASHLISGDLIGAFATAEPEAGGDLRPSTLLTVAEPVPGGLRVNGRKRWIINSTFADWAAVLCRQGDAATMLLVDMRNSPGVRVGRPDRTVGHPGQFTADIVLEDVFVPYDHVLGSPGHGVDVASSCLVRGRIGIGAAGVGLAQSAIDMTVAHLRTSQAFEAQPERLQNWHLRVAQRATEIECARILYRKASMLLDIGHSSCEPEAAMAKAMGSRVAVDAVCDAIQVHGVLGFPRQAGEAEVSCRLEIMNRDAKVLEIFEGANQLQQQVIARSLIGRAVTDA